VLYPRASAIGGCGIHNVLILMYGSNSDWDRIADTMNDGSWSATNMRKYYQRIEQCRYITPGALPISDTGSMAGSRMNSKTRHIYRRSPGSGLYQGGREPLGQFHGV